jgi:hypothetical protein
MAGSGVKLFLSCVSDEFGDYRDALRKALTRPNVEVKIQEDFKPLGGDTLRMLEEYIEQCEAVVHFVGDMAGSTPATSSVDDLLARRTGLEASLASKGLAHEAHGNLTYTQWEAWLAIAFDKNLLIVEPAENVSRGVDFAPTDASRATQAQHLKRLRAIDRHPGPPFTSADNLVAQIVTSAVIDALVKAAKKPTRQPRNLPFASLGNLFMGRERELDDLRAALVSAKGAAVVGRALHGLGGVGKTRLAIEYALRNESHYSALLFVRADDVRTLDANLAALVSSSVLDLQEKESREDAAKIEAVLGWLEANPLWLLILDNVDDGEAVAAVSRLMSRLKGGHIIVTARAANFPANIRKLELDVLEEDAAAAFLLERTADDRSKAADDEQRAHEIAAELGRLALGLEQAGAYIATERVGFARYLKLWRESRQRVVDWFDGELMTYAHDAGLAATWATSVARLSPESRRLLDLLAMLAPDPIPDSILDVPVPGEAADYDAHRARASLYAYSLITHARGKDGSARGFVMHRLVQDFVSRAMTNERRTEVLQQALNWVNAAFEPDPAGDARAPARDLIAPHAFAVVRQAKETGIEPPGRLNELLIIWSYFKTRRTHAEMISQLRRAMSIDYAAALGPDYLEVAHDLSHVASLLDDVTDRIVEAESVVVQAVLICKRRLGADHPMTMRMRENLTALGGPHALYTDYSAFED